MKKSAKKVQKKSKRQAQKVSRRIQRKSSLSKPKKPRGQKKTQSGGQIRPQQPELSQSEKETSTQQEKDKKAPQNSQESPEEKPIQIPQASPEKPPSIAPFLGNITDPRCSRRKHLLTDIILIVIISILCGVENWDEIELFGKCHETILKNFLELPYGIPSADTLNRVISLINKNAIIRAFSDWMMTFHKNSPGDLLAIDGKTLRRSFKKGDRNTAVHVVEMDSVFRGLMLSQKYCDNKKNEISAILSLLGLTEFSGCTITIDAIGCQTEIVEVIHPGQGDYVIGLKANQPNLLAAVSGSFERGFQEAAELSSEVTMGHHVTHNKGHGRIETRNSYTLTADECKAYGFELDPDSKWPKLNAAIRVDSTVTRGGKTSTETRDYITSHDRKGENQKDKIEFSKEMGAIVRGHWGIENQLHWILDVSFREDDSRKRQKNAAENVSLIRRMALNLLKKDSAKGSINIKRKRKMWNLQSTLESLALDQPAWV